MNLIFIRDIEKNPKNLIKINERVTSQVYVFYTCVLY